MKTFASMRAMLVASVSVSAFAVALVASGQPYFGLVMALFVLVMAVMLRTGHSGVWLSLLIVAVDTEALVFMFDQPPVPVMVGCASVAVLLASTRLDPRFTAASAALAFAGLRAQIIRARILHGGHLTPSITSTQYLWFLLPVVLALLIIGIMLWSRPRRLTAYLARSRRAPAPDPQAGYRDPATGWTQMVVCASCHAPLTEGKPKCWLCGAVLEEAGTIEASRLPERIFDPRVGRNLSILTASVGGLVVLSSVALGSQERAASPAALVVPALFAVLTLIPLLGHLRSPGGRRGEMLATTGADTAMGIVLSVVLALSVLILAFTALAVVVSAVCTAQGFSLR